MGRVSALRQYNPVLPFDLQNVRIRERVNNDWTVLIQVVLQIAVISPPAHLLVVEATLWLQEPSGRTWASAPVSRATR